MSRQPFVSAILPKLEGADNETAHEQAHRQLPHHGLESRRCQTASESGAHRGRIT
jgi:hypothetical protein